MAPSSKEHPDLFLGYGSKELPYTSFRFLSKASTLYVEAKLEQSIGCPTIPFQRAYDFATTFDIETAIEPTVELSGDHCFILPAKKPCIFKLMAVEDLEPKYPSNTCMLARNRPDNMIYLPHHSVSLCFNIWKTKEKEDKPYSIAWFGILKSKYTYQTFPTVFRVKVVLSDKEEEVKRCCLKHEPKYWGNKHMFFDHKEEC